MKIEAVFAAKQTPLWILCEIENDDDFANDFQRGFDQVKGPVSGPLHGFEVYLEHVRFLIRDICPNIPPRDAQGAQSKPKTHHGRGV